MPREKLHLLSREIETYKRKSVEERKRREEESHIIREAERKFWGNERRLLQSKIGICGYILNWRDNFIGTKQFSDLFDGENDDITIFSNVWGHTKDGEGYGYWSNMILYRCGELAYEAGYKWFGVSKQFYLDRSKNTASKLTFKYLKELQETIKSGEVYKNIVRELKERDPCPDC